MAIRWILPAFLFAAGPLSAATIIEVVKTDPISIFASYGGECSPACERGQAAGWSQTESFTNVTVEADLGGLYSAFEINNAGTGHAYLMRQIGPGTTVANQVAFTTFPGVGGNVALGMTTLFTGLTLGPGTYYLVLGSDAASAGTWAVDTSPTINGAIGSAYLGRFWINGDDSPLNPAFLPAEDIQSFAAHGLPFRVTGDSRTELPEPSSLLLAGTGILIVLLSKRKLFHRARSR
jgi:hypothetical protein